jgi:polysaccharide transporter, PST family
MINRTITLDQVRFAFGRVFRRPTYRNIVANTMWLSADKVVCCIVSVFVGAWMARYLKPASFGVYSYAIAFAHLLMPLAGLGLQSIVVRAIIRQPAGKDEILGTALVLQLCVSSMLIVVLALVLALGIGPQDNVLRWLILIMAGELVLNAFSDPVGYWFESQLQSRYTVWARDVAVVSTGFLKIGLILAGASVVAFGIATLAQFLVFSAGSILLYQLTGNRLLALRASIGRARQLLCDSWPLIFASLSVVIYMKIDQIMLAHLAGREALGNYSVAVHLSEVWYFIPMAISQSLFPSIVRSRDKLSSVAFSGRMQAFFDLMSGAAYLLIIFMTLIAAPLVLGLFGSEYAEAVPILKVHIWALAFVSLGAARSKWLMAENLVRFQLFATVLGAVVNIGLNFLLIPKYVGVGAAWATLVSYGVAAYGSSLFYKPVWPVFRQLTLALLVPFRLSALWRAIPSAGRD